MSTRKHLPVDRVIHAVRECKGALSLAAQRLGCSRTTVYSMMKKHQVIATAVQEAREELVDIAELRLRKAVEEDQAWAISLVLRTLGKSRGYVERHEVSGQDGEALHIHLTWDDAEPASLVHGSTNGHVARSAPEPEPETSAADAHPLSFDTPALADEDAVDAELTSLVDALKRRVGGE